MRNLFLLLLGLIVLNQNGHASETEILWVKLDKLFTYKDIERICTTKDLPPTILFGAEIFNGNVQAATFKTDTVDILAERLPFTKSELNSVKVSADLSGRKWVQSIKLNARQLNWIFTKANWSGGCVPTQPLATLDPNDFVYEYNLSEIMLEPQVASNLGKFSGKRNDGRLYQITLSLNQKQIP